MNNTYYGKHIYEGKEYVDEDGNIVKGRNWRWLPSITPLSMMNENNSDFLVKHAKKAKSVYEKAEPLGIISEDRPYEYALRTINDSFLDEIISISGSAKTKGDAVVMFEASEKIKNMKANPTYSRKVYHIKNDAKNGDYGVTETDRKKVRIDHFAFAPKSVEIAENEIEKLKKIDEIIVSLVPVVDNDFENFANALFTGVITINGIMLTYENDSFEEIKLSTPSMTMGGCSISSADLYELCERACIYN